MKFTKFCTESTFAFFTKHNYSKWKEIGREQRTEGQHSILSGNIITWQGVVSQQRRECEDCGDIDYQEKKI